MSKLCSVRLLVLELNRALYVARTTEEKTKNSRCCSCSLKYAELRHFTSLSCKGQQRNVPRFYNARVQPLFCSLNFGQFGDVLHAVVVCLRSLLPDHDGMLHVTLHVTRYNQSETYGMLERVCKLVFIWCRAVFAQLFCICVQFCVMLFTHCKSPQTLITFFSCFCDQFTSCFHPRCEKSNHHCGVLNCALKAALKKCSLGV